MGTVFVHLVFAHQISVKLLGQCATRHCDDNQIVIGKKAGSSEKPKCIYSVEEECQPPLACEHAKCVEPSLSTLHITAPTENGFYGRKDSIEVLFETAHPPEGSHIDVTIDGLVHHDAVSPTSLGSLGSGKHVSSVAVVNRDHKVLQQLEKSISFTVSATAITGPTLFVESSSLVHDPEMQVTFTAYNMPSTMHVDAFLNGELVKHNVQSPFNVYLQEGKNTIVFQFAHKDESFDETKKEVHVNYVPDPCSNVACSSPPDSCFSAVGTCHQGECSYNFLPEGTVCSLINGCDGKGGCTVTRPKPVFSSFVSNPFHEEKKGKVFIALEKKKSGKWGEVYSIDPRRITIQPYSYFDVASFWNQKADFTFTEAGEYRFFVQFDTLQMYKEFTVKEKKNKR